MDLTAKVSHILVGGWGQRVAIGYLFGFLEAVTPEEVYAYINEKRPLFPNVSDGDWGKWRKLARQAGLEEITADRIIAEFQQRRLDLLQVVYNTPGGMEWVQAQVTTLHEKLRGS